MLQRRIIIAIITAAVIIGAAITVDVLSNRTEPSNISLIQPSGLPFYEFYNNNSYPAASGCFNVSLGGSSAELAYVAVVPNDSYLLKRYVPDVEIVFFNIMQHLGTSSSGFSISVDSVFMNMDKQYYNLTSGGLTFQLRGSVIYSNVGIDHEKALFFEYSMISYGTLWPVISPFIFSFTFTPEVLNGVSIVSGNTITFNHLIRLYNDTGP